MIELTEAHLRKLLAEAWDSGFDESGEGYNGEYLRDTSKPLVVEARDNAIVKIMSEVWTLTPEDY